MAEVAAFLDEFFRQTAFLRSFLFALACFTCFWRGLRSTAFRNVLWCVSALTGSYVVAVPLAAFLPEVALFFRVLTFLLLVLLGWSCIQYLRRDPPDFRQLFQRQTQRG